MTILQAWIKSTAKEWNLSSECLTSKTARKALDIYLRANPDLHKEIEDRTGTVRFETDGTAVDNDDIDTGIYDDTDIPFSAVVEETFGGINIPATETGEQGFSTTVTTSICSPEGGLMANDENENVWAWNNGVKWGDLGELPADLDVENNDI